MKGLAWPLDLKLTQIPAVLSACSVLRENFGTSSIPSTLHGWSSGSDSCRVTPSGQAPWSQLISRSRWIPHSFKG